MKNKKGFTLAEVLITLGVVGVIAALTAPGLILGTMHETNASKLSVTMANLENAFTTAIPAEGVADLTETAMWQQTFNTAVFAGELGRYLHISGADATINYTIFPIDSTTENNGLTTNWITGSIPIITKNGAIVYIRQQLEDKTRHEDTIRNIGGSLIRQVGTVAIDVNGRSEPNQYGRDVFVFRIGEDGILFPEGGRDVAAFISAGNNITRIHSNNDADGAWRCTNTNKGQGTGCTARVIEEGFKISY